MATQPHPTTPSPAAEPAKPPAAPGVPGGMASDPAIAVANEIVSTIKGSMEKARKEVADKEGASLTAEIAQTIRIFVNNEVNKAIAATPPVAPAGPTASNATKR